MKLLALLVLAPGCSVTAASTKAPPPAPASAVLSFMDPVTTPSQSAALCAGDSIELVVPMQPGTDWQVAHAAVPATEREIDRWLGPSTPGLAFRFQFDGKRPYEQIALVDRSVVPAQTVTADLTIGCD